MKTAYTHPLDEIINTLNSQIPKEEWLAPSQVAEELSMHINTIYRLIQSGELGAYNLILGSRGRKYYRIKRSDLEDWLDMRRCSF